MTNQFKTSNVILLLAGLALGLNASSETLGAFGLSEVVLRPRFDVVEPAKGEFRIGESMASLDWKMDPGIKAVVSLGPESLIGRTVHFASATSENMALIEAYAEFSSPYGIWRLGMQPVAMSIEGRRRETELELARGQLYRSRWLGLRDVGLSYEVESGGYYTRLMVHNGEDTSKSDGRPWYTGSWGWRDDKRLSVGINGQTGTTKPESTSASLNTLAGVDNNKEARWRFGGPFAVWTPPRWRVELEYYGGDVEQESLTTSFAFARFEARYESLSRLASVIRYEYVDANRSIGGDEIEEVSLAFGVSSHRGTSRLWLMGTKAFERVNEVPNDRLMLMWQLSPLFVSQD